MSWNDTTCTFLRDEDDDDDDDDDRKIDMRTSIGRLSSTRGLLLAVGLDFLAVVLDEVLIIRGADMILTTGLLEAADDICCLRLEAVVDAMSHKDRFLLNRTGPDISSTIAVAAATA
eukprot:CAMPEP_0113456330 /NCGR_PEP_ID=MMETSP0014_2-20120614/8831_1 /TAXON_ID=2857 /ORGANISM="Nitzschia sp." /LENGTH=116 /DNA_ID=CAMNT_0000347779 /DNA_START=517 /DNA_END=867 /DNA_ORIENTATION=+ /assembly_acc=CAM_ASM_000159